MNKTGHGKPILEFFIFHAVSTQQHHTGLPDLVDSSLDHRSKNGKLHLLEGKAHQIHGCFGLPAHGVDIAQGIGRGDLFEIIRPAHWNRLEIPVRATLHPGPLEAIWTLSRRL